MKSTFHVYGFVNEGTNELSATIFKEKVNFSGDQFVYIEPVEIDWPEELLEQQRAAATLHVDAQIEYLEDRLYKLRTEKRAKLGAPADSELKNEKK